MDRCKNHHYKPLCIIPIALLIIASAIFPLRNADGAVFYNFSDEIIADTTELAILGTVEHIESGSDSAGTIYTYVKVDVTEVLKGSFSGTDLVVRRPGGESGGKGTVIFGVPDFTAGEDVALLLRSNGGWYEAVGMALGKFKVVTGKGKEKSLERDMSMVTVKTDGRFKGTAPAPGMKLDDLKGLLKRSKPVAHKPTTGDTAVSLPLTYGVSLPYTYMSGPSRHFPSGIPVQMTVNTANNPLGDATAAYNAVIAAFDGWNDQLLTPILSVTGTSSSNTKALNVRFNDPDGEIADPSNCSGTMGYGGYSYTTSGTLVQNGTTFYQAYDSFMIVNNGWDSGGCTLLTDVNNLIDIMMHEAGHMICIGHSADTNALMYPTLYSLGSYGALQHDDLLALRSLYPDLGRPIPTLSEWGAIALILLMIATVYRKYASRD